jgi:hypothetical protein
MLRKGGSEQISAVGMARFLGHAAKLCPSLWRGDRFSHATRGTIDVNPIGEREMKTHSKEQMVTGEGSGPAICFF